MATLKKNKKIEKSPLADTELEKVNEKFSEVVSAISLRVALQEGHEGCFTAPSRREMRSGPLTQQELSELTLLCAKQGSINTLDDNPVGFAAVEGDLLITIIELLDRHVSLAAGVDLLKDVVKVINEDDSQEISANMIDEWLASDADDKITTLKMGLEAACIILFIVSSKGIDRRAISEDAIEAAITLMRLNLKRALLPALNNQPLFRERAQSEKNGSNEDIPPAKKRRRSSAEGSGIVPKHLKKVYKRVIETTNLQLILMERSEQLIKQVSLDDQQVLILSNGVLVALEIDAGSNGSAAQRLQLATVDVITAAFRKYSMHRETILEDVFPLMLKLPSGKKSLRTFQLRYSTASSPHTLSKLNSDLVISLLPNAAVQHRIQMITAMILSMFQSCVVPPTFQIPEKDGSSSEATEVTLVSGLNECTAACDSFALQLVKRCSRTKTGASEFRPVLSNIVEDLLMALLDPDYPVAEMLLFSFAKCLHQEIGAFYPSNKSVSSSTNPEATFLNVAFDTLGKICSVEARILATQNKLSLRMTTEKPGVDDGDVRLDCMCGSNEMQNVFLVNCDHCNLYYHGACVGVNSNCLPEAWLCDACRLCRIGERDRHRYGSTGEHMYIDLLYCVYRSFISSVSHRLGVPNIDLISQLHLARFVDYLEQIACKGKKNKPHGIVSDILEKWEAPQLAGEVLSEEGSSRAALTVLAKTSTLALSFRSQVKFILTLMEDDSPQMLRKLALKAIEKIVEGDPQLMALPVITKAVSRRLSDESISVREAAVSLVGSYATQSSSIAYALHSALLPCLKDDGVSVRKRVVRIFKDVLISYPDYAGRSSVCNALLQHAVDPKEEDIVRELIQDLFCGIWFSTVDSAVDIMPTSLQLSDHGFDESTPASSQEVIVHNIIPGVVTPTPPTLKSKKYFSSISKKPADFAAEQMMEMVRVGATKDNLEAFFKSLLHNSDKDKGKKKNERSKSLQLGLNHCSKICDALFELLLSVEEQRSVRGGRIGKDIAATLQTIVVFASLTPNAVCKHVDALLPYLKADNGVSYDDESLIVGAACEILFHLASSCCENVAERLASTSCPKDLLQIAYKFGSIALDPAVRALCSLSKNTEASDSFNLVLIEMCKKFYAFLYRIRGTKDFTSEDERTRSSCHRALTVLGMVCQHDERLIEDAKWMKEVDSLDSDLVSPGELCWENLTFSCFRIFYKFLQKRDAPTQCIALRALGGVMGSQPRLMLQLEQAGLIEEVMSDGSHSSLQMEALKCWKRILEHEEKRIDGGRADEKLAKNEKISISEKVSGDQDGDSTLLGGVLTSHAGRLFELTHSKNPAIRLASLELIGQLLRQGLINPNETIPYLFALQGDIENAPIRNFALDLLVSEAERRPLALRQRAGAGVTQAYKFQKMVYSKHPSALVRIARGKKVDSQCIFSSVFTQCIASSRKQRHGLVQNLLGFFQSTDGEKKVSTPRHKRGAVHVEEGSRDLKLLSFISEVLAHLPYSAADDPLFIVHHIGSIVALDGPQIIEKFAALLRPLGLSKGDELDDSNESEDALEIAARAKFPSRCEQARWLCSKKFPLEDFASLCLDGAAIVLLLRLKTFLRKTYNLSEMRILEYDLNSTEKVIERKIHRTDMSTPFDATIPIVFHEENGNLDRDALLRQYAEFRRAMREEFSSNFDEDASGDQEVGERVKKRDSEEL